LWLLTKITPIAGTLSILPTILLNHCNIETILLKCFVLLSKYFEVNLIPKECNITSKNLKCIDIKRCTYEKYYGYISGFLSWRSNSSMAANMHVRCGSTHAHFKISCLKHLLKSVWFFLSMRIISGSNIFRNFSYNEVRDFIFV